MIVIDANALVVLLVGLIRPTLINRHKRTSIYDDRDFEELILEIGDLSKLLILPNVWTEVDNLLNNFGGQLKNAYVSELKNLTERCQEQYLETEIAAQDVAFYDLGLTDTLLLITAKQQKKLITSDSLLSDYARAYGIQVYDMVAVANSRLH